MVKNTKIGNNTPDLIQCSYMSPESHKLVVYIIVPLCCSLPTPYPTPTPTTPPPLPPPK